jgi:hypothetical protein
MIRVWLFDLNPNGPFGGTHPCFAQDGVSDEEVIEGREVPDFFQH